MRPRPTENSMVKTRERQNQIQADSYRLKGPATMGPWTSHIWRTDPRHLGFLLARYKFCAKMLAGKQRVLEIGCGDAFGATLILQTVKALHCIDVEPLVIEDARARFAAEGIERCTFAMGDITSAPPEGTFDAAYLLDVIEHVPTEAEGHFMNNLCELLRPNAVCIVGTPNITASQYASAGSREGHVNLKSADSLRASLLGWFDNVFVFSMNDEVVHTGYHPMGHYLLALAVGLRR